MIRRLLGLLKRNKPQKPSQAQASTKKTNRKKLLQKRANKPTYLDSERVEIEKYSEFLGDFGDNYEQKRAVVSDSKRILVLAGAGSGKTKVLTKRIIHLLKNKNIPRDNILAITFTKDAAKEMRERIAKTLNVQDDSLKQNVRTIHSLCFSILKQNEQFDILSEKEQIKLVNDIVLSLVEDEDIMESLYDYLLLDIIPKLRERESKNSIVPQAKDKPHHNNEKTIKTDCGIEVRSKSERDIANFLSLLGIEFEYEKPVNFGEGEFKPDFTINNEIFIEHWAYHKNSKPGDKIDKEKYLRIREWKENQYKKYHKKLISIEEDEMLDLLKLKERLGRELKDIIKTQNKKDDILNQIGLNSIYKEPYEIFLEELVTIINLAKSRLLTVEEIQQSVNKVKKDKVRNFYNVFLPVFVRYNEEIKRMGYSKKDFNDLIKDTIELLKNSSWAKDYYQNKYKHILVDEFQDVGYAEVEFLNMLVGKGTHLFVVGDDWQSIYGWRGSDIKYIIDFESIFGNSEKIILPYNYRSNKNIVEASSYFIQKSGKLIEKNIKCTPQNQCDDTKIVQINTKDCDKTAFNYIRNTVENSIRNGESSGKNDFMVLYRARRTVSKDTLKYLKSYFGMGRVKTIHGSKGLEAKYVFVLGLKGGPTGFPQIYADKEIKKVILDRPLSDKEEEERRIFYVAMTRAKKKLFLISEDGNESVYLSDIPNENKYVSKPRNTSQNS